MEQQAGFRHVYNETYVIPEDLLHLPTLPSFPQLAWKRNTWPVTIVVAHYKEHVTWLCELDPTQFHIVLYSRFNASIHGPETIGTLDSAPHVEHVYLPHNIGVECNVYLHYITSNYNNLSPHTVFIHAQRLGWHTHVPLDRMIGHLQYQSFAPSAYIDLNLELFSCVRFVVENNHHDMSILVRMWKEILTPKYGFGEHHPKRTFCVHCCAQFVLSRERIHDFPVQLFWELYMLPMGKQGGGIGNYFEYLWPILFGEPAFAKPHVCQLFNCSAWRPPLHHH